MPRKTTRAALVLPLVATLAACGTPQDRCISQNTREYRTVSSLLAEVEGNLARGYAWEERQVERDRLSYCRDYERNSDGTVRVVTRHCWRDYTTTERFRVPIDPAAETRKRDNLVARKVELAPQAKAYVEACRTAFPEAEDLAATAPAP